MIYIVEKERRKKLWKKHSTTTKKRIETATKDGDIKDLMISISQDCSAYKLSWEEFLTLRKALIERGKAVGNRWIIQCH